MKKDKLDPDKEKEEKIKKEAKRFKEVFNDFDENKQKFVDVLIDDLSWLIVTNKELQENINRLGTLLPYDNGGGQTGYRKNPDVITQIQYSKNITAITKQLIDIAPTKPQKSKLQALREEFGRDERGFR